MSTNAKNLAQFLAQMEDEKGAGNWKPHEIFATSLCRPQGILVFLGPYGICYFSPTMIQTKYPLGKITLSLHCNVMRVSIHSL